MRPRWMSRSFCVVTVPSAETTPQALTARRRPHGHAPDDTRQRRRRLVGQFGKRE